MRFSMAKLYETDLDPSIWGEPEEGSIWLIPNSTIVTPAGQKLQQAMVWVDGAWRWMESKRQITACDDDE